ncbi:hypothetical protein COOONC_23347, partial [Cooperia oncophora]
VSKSNDFKSSKKFKRSKTPTTLFKKHFPRRGKSKKGSTKNSLERITNSTSAVAASKQASEKAFQPPLGEQPQALHNNQWWRRQQHKAISSGSDEQAATCCSVSGIAVQCVQDGRTVQMEDHRQAIELALDTKPGTVPATASFHATASHVPRSTSRSRRRSTSRSTSRVQIPGHKLHLIAPLIRIAVLCSRISTEFSDQSTEACFRFARSKAFKSIERVPPAVVNVKTMDDDGFQEEKTTQNVLIGNKMIIVERRSCLLVYIYD